MMTRGPQRGSPSGMTPNDLAWVDLRPKRTGQQGIEPWVEVLETTVLPLHHRPVTCYNP